MKHLQADERLAYCNHCQKNVTCHFDPVNHGMNLLLTVLTCGIWLPMWLIAIFNPTRICDVCNEPIWKDK